MFSADLGRSSRSQLHVYKERVIIDVADAVFLNLVHETCGILTRCDDAADSRRAENGV